MANNLAIAELEDQRNRAMAEAKSYDEYVQSLDPLERITHTSMNRFDPEMRETSAMADLMQGAGQEYGRGGFFRPGDFLPGSQQALAARDVAEIGRAVDEANSIMTPEPSMLEKGLLTGAQGLAGLGMLPMVGGVTAPLRKGAMKAAARAGVGKTKQRVGTTGKYVGAPSNITSPQALGKMRKEYMDQVVEGVGGADWYDDASQWTRSVSPNDVRAQQIGDVLGVTSQGTGVDSNLGFTVKGVNQAATGLPVNTGRFPGNQSPLIEKILAGEEPSLGPKREPFAQNLSVAWNPERATTPVHDIWQGRAMGYTHPNGKPWDAGFSPQQHAFMDEQMNVMSDQLNATQAGGRSDWGPLNTQAAAWTGAKIRAGEVDPADAAKHYGDFSQKYQAFGTYEQTPGAGIGHLPGMVDAPLAERQAFSADPRSSWVNERGQDQIYSDLGMIVEPTNQSIGAYTPASTGQLEINPAEAARPLVQMAADENKVRHVMPESRELLDVAEGTRAYIDAQNAGAWNKPIATNPAGAQNSLWIPLEQSPGEEQMKALAELAQKRGMFTSDTGQGVSLINDPFSELGKARTGTTLGKELKKGGLTQEISDVLGQEVDAIRNTIDTGYIDYEKAWLEGSGAATRQVLDLVESNPTILNSLDNSSAIRNKAMANLERDAEMAARTGQPVRDDIQNARRILAEGGFRGLRAALNRGEVLPAIFAAAVVPAVVMNDSETDSM